ncbi:hypothetical protein [Massilia sp. ST3]|uniref:hypothetical protein n=1 Tax=Massilia sp. ST3 TaxID=2824903 RepID=UPI001B81B57B|nr:hypothetical protein [Massilia sp. ST3]MBQ5948827.1 hypothetical protein [Massilia sp. ST3]
MQAAGRNQVERIGRLVYAQVRGEWLVGEAARLAARSPAPALDLLLARGRALGARCQLLSGLFPDPPADDTDAATAGMIALNEEIHRYLDGAGWP